MFECKELDRLSWKELSFEPEYTIDSDRVEEMIDRNDASVDNYMTEESKKRIEELTKAKEDHLATCTHEGCVQIRKNREDLLYRRLSQQ